MLAASLWQGIGRSPMSNMRIVYWFLFVTGCTLLIVVPFTRTHAHANVDTAKASAAKDASHDFDWDYGTWKTHQRRLLHPLTGSTTWVDYEGTDVVQKIWDGANTGLIKADGPAGHLEIYTL